MDMQLIDFLDNPYREVPKEDYLSWGKLKREDSTGGVERGSGKCNKLSVMEGG